MRLFRNRGDTGQRLAARANVFDVQLLADRLATVTGWLAGRSGVAELAVGYFGASTGAAAALWAAGHPATRVRAVVSRGSWPDLATPRLGEARAPALLIVSARDHVVHELNRDAVRQLLCEHRLEVIPGATHLFEEPGALDTVAEMACQWFTHHLASAARPTV